MTVDYIQPTAKWWDDRCVAEQGYLRVMNKTFAFNPQEMLAETSRQKQFIKDMPIPWNRFEMAEIGGKPHHMEQVTSTDDVVLDVGCGIGRLTQFLAEMGADCFGLDWSERMIGVADRNFPSLKWAVGDARDGSMFDEGAFGATFEWCVFCHLTDERSWLEAVRNMRRWASKRAIFVDFLEGGQDSTYTRQWGKSRLVDAMLPWVPIYEADYISRMGAKVLDAFQALVFAPAENDALVIDEKSAASELAEPENIPIELPEAVAAVRRVARGRGC